MSMIKKAKQCALCGAILQSDSPDKEGYITHEVFNDEDNLILFCNKCFEIKKNNDVVQEPALNKEFLTILKDAVKERALIVYVVDLFSFEKSFISEINNYISSLDVVVVANKLDLLPLKLNKEKLITYVENRCRLSNLNVKGVVLMEMNPERTLSDALAEIKGMNPTKNVYVIGSKASGKSTIISSFLKSFKNITKRPIVTYNYPNTDLRVTKIPVTEKISLFEVEGFNNENSLVTKVEKPVASMITPKRRVMPRQVIIKKGQSVVIGGLSRFDLLDGPATKFTFYLAEDVELKRIASKDITKTVEEIIKKKSLEPVSINFKTIDDFDAYEIEDDEEGLRDIGVFGLGWASYEGNGQKIRIVVPKDVSIYTGKAKIQ